MSILSKPEHDRSYGRLHNAAQRYRWYNSRISHDPVSAHQNRNSVTYAQPTRQQAIDLAITYVRSFMDEYLTDDQARQMDSSIDLWFDYFSEPSFEEVQIMLEQQLVKFLDRDYVAERQREGLPI